MVLSVARKLVARHDSIGPWPDTDEQSELAYEPFDALDELELELEDELLDDELLEDADEALDEPDPPPPQAASRAHSAATPRGMSFFDACMRPSEMISERPNLAISQIYE